MGKRRREMQIEGAGASGKKMRCSCAQKFNPRARFPLKVVYPKAKVCCVLMVTFLQGACEIEARRLQQQKTFKQVPVEVELPHTDRADMRKTP